MKQLTSSLLTAASMLASTAFADPSSVLIVADGSVSMRRKNENGDTRFQDLEKSVSGVLPMIPASTKVGVNAFGVTGTEPCDGQNVHNVVVPSNEASVRGGIPGRVHQIKLGYGSPVGVAISKGVAELTGVEVKVPLRKDDLSDDSGATAIPDSGMILKEPTADAPMLVVVTDMRDTCKADLCQLMKEIQKSKANVRIRIIGVDMKANYLGQKTLNCMAQYPKFDFEEVLNGKPMFNAMEKTVKGEELRAKALRLEYAKKPPVAPAKGPVRAKTSLSGMILPKEEVKAEVVKPSPIEELRAKQLRWEDVYPTKSDH